MPDLDFVHLHVHSSYSLLEGALPIARLADLAKADRQPALALTDTDNMFGALEFSEKLAGNGIQPIVGCALALDFGDTENGQRNGHHGPPRTRIVLLAAREAGYRSLMRLSSRAFLDTPPNEPPRLKLDWLAGETDDVIALTGGPGGPLDLAIAGGQRPLAAARLDTLLKLFGDRLYVELQRHGTAAERGVESALIDLAYGKGIPLVATNEAYFATAADYEAHDALICIAEGRLLAEGDRRQLTPEHRFKTRREMVELFVDLPEAVASTVEIARRCAFRPRTHKPILPRFSVGEGGAVVDEAAELRKRAEAGLTRRLTTQGLAAGHTEDEYRERLDFELGVIERMKYPGYFLIVADFIQWAKAQGIPVGPGRGSGAGSLVAYSLTITDLDPIRFGLLFERFLNPERVSMPDFDIDFCQDRRDEVIRYVQERYGRDQVAQIITFGTLQARGVLRDVGRVLQMPYGQVDKLCKLVPQNPAHPVTLARAIDDEPRLQAEQHRRQHHHVVHAQVLHVGGLPVVVPGHAHQRNQAAVGRHGADGFAKRLCAQVVQRHVDAPVPAPCARGLDKIFAAIGDRALGAQFGHQLDLRLAADRGRDPRTERGCQLHGDVPGAARARVHQHEFAARDLRTFLQ